MNRQTAIRRFRAHLAASLAVVCALALLPPPGSAQAGFPSPADWRDETIYQLITDRFDNGDATNDALGTTYSPSAGDKTHGGDFRGIERRLDYLKGLGVTSIWISPIPRNANGEYHGYAADDFTTLAAHWGTPADLDSMLAAAHQRGIRVILDVVCNHGGDLIGNNSYRAPPATWPIAYRSASKQHAAPFTALSNWHAQGNIGNWTDPEQVVGELFGLDDLKTEDATVRNQLATIYGDWITRFDFDGFRIDTVKHVEMGFWQAWPAAIRTRAAARGKTNFLLFGEVYDGNEVNCGRFTGTKAGGAFALDSVLDYPMYYRTNSVFATASGGAQDIAGYYGLAASAYDPAARDRLVTFLDNHDNARFLSTSLAAGNEARLWAALVFQYTSPGVPCVYYGTEQGFDGGGDPNCREDMFDGQWEFGPSLGNNFDQTAPGYLLIRRLAQLRRDHSPLRRGTFNSRQAGSSPGVFAYSRVEGGQEVLVAVNTSDSAQTALAWPTGFASGTVLVDALNPTVTRTVGSGGTLPAGFSMPGNGFHVFVPQARLTRPDPEVIGCSIAPGAALTTNSTPLILNFSASMSRSAVEAATTCTPPAALAFTWNTPSDTVTILPVAGAWPGPAQMRVRVGEAAADSFGATLRGGFEAEFTTATPPPPAVDSAVDGIVAGDPRWGAPVAVQSVRTGFGDSNAGGPDINSGGSEANALYLASDAQSLFVAVTGNLEINGNALNLLFDLDGGSGGVTTLGGSTTAAFLSGTQSAAGTRMPGCMTCDLILQVQLRGPGQQLSLNAYRWNTAGQLVFAGLVGSLPASSGAPTRGVVSGAIAGVACSFDVAYDNRNTGPVAAGSTAASPDGSAAQTGLEIRIPRTLLGAGPWRVMAGISGSTGYWSNQFLPPVTPQANLAWAPNLATAGGSCVQFVPGPASAVEDWRTLW